MGLSLWLTFLGFLYTDIVGSWEKSPAELVISHLSRQLDPEFHIKGKHNKTHLMTSQGYTGGLRALLKKVITVYSLISSSDLCEETDTLQSNTVSNGLTKYL